MAGVRGGSRFSKISHTYDSRQRALDGWSLFEEHEYFTPSTGPYAHGEDSVFDVVEDFGFEHAGWTSHKSLKALRENTIGQLTDEQRDHIVEHVNSTLEKELNLTKTTLKTGQIVYRNRAGKFSRLVPMTSQEKKIIAKIENQR